MTILTKSRILVLITFCMLFTALHSCKKQEVDDFSGDGTFAGTLTYANPYSGDSTVHTLPNANVCLAYHTSDTINFIYSVQTDGEGKFVFKNVDKNTTYDVFYTDTMNNLLYVAIVTTTPDNDSIKLHALPNVAKQNGLSVLTTNATGNGLGDVQVSMYDNKDIYLADSIAGVTSAATYTITTNLYGINTLYNVKTGTYYLAAHKQTDNIVLTGHTYIQVGAAGIARTNITLTPGHSLKIATTDAAGNKMEAVTVTAYDNYDIFKADSAANTTTGSVKTVTTNAAGFESWPNAPAATYHFIAKKQAGTLLLAGYKHKQLAANISDSISIPLSPVPVPVPNALNITVHDTDNNAINEATVFLYTSNIVAQLDTLRAAFTYSVTTTAAGTVTKTELPSATYYLFGRKIIGTDTLVGAVTTFVPVLGTANALIKIK